MLRPAQFFDLDVDPVIGRTLSSIGCVWDILPAIPKLVSQLVGAAHVVDGLIMPGAAVADEGIYIGPGAVVEPGAYIQGPAYIGPGVTIRHGAYVRSNCIFLEGSVLGHASEAKNSLFMPYAKAPHFAYAGDSILGMYVNLGAGTKLSNLPVEISSNRKTIKIVYEGCTLDTGLTKLGAIVGDYVETGCNVVTNPGALFLPRSFVYPGTVVPKGVHPGNTVIKLRQTLERSAVRSQD